jgi:hypothetical protein
MATRNIPAPSNPYASGAVVFDSTPYTEFYVKEQQKEQAKDEALDKYFQDYDKSINPAGMRNIDTQDFLNLMNENKGFYFKNKSAIKNPALDNGAAYNEWFARNKDAMGLVSQSKYAAKKESDYGKRILDAKMKGMPIVGKAIRMIEDFNKPIRGGWKDFNVEDIEFEPKPFEQAKFSQEVFKGVPFDVTTKELKVPELKKIKKITETFIPDKALESIYNKAAYSYDENPSVKFFVDSIAPSSERYNSLNKLFSSKFNRNIDGGEDLAAALALSIAPVGQSKETMDWDREALEKMKDGYIRSRQRASASGKKSSAADTFDFITKGLEIADSGNSELLNNYFSAWKVGQKTDVQGNKIGFQSATVNPNGEIEVVYNSGINTKAGTVANPNLITEKIKVSDPQAKNKLLQLDQQFLGGDMKTERAARSEAGTAAPTTNSKETKPKTLAERMKEAAQKKGK